MDSGSGCWRISTSARIRTPNSSTRSSSEVRQEKLDLIALAGDFVSGDPGVLAPLLEKLGKMQRRPRSIRRDGQSRRMDRQSATITTAV